MVERNEDIGWVMSQRGLDVEKSKTIRLERRAAAQARHEELRAEDLRERGLSQAGTLEIQKPESIEMVQNQETANSDESMPVGRIVILVVVVVALLAICISQRRAFRSS